ncbi:MAG TPA: ATPase, T2SS/T4P/T4SS family [Acidimicrobiales bacterium]|nr:ATPase, T2SS/T4P/T4SS family [Acidimicrobiales bacterium]
MILDRGSVVGRVRAEVADDLAASGMRSMSVGDRRELARQLALTRLQSVAAERLVAGEQPVDVRDEQRLAQEVLDALFGLGKLQALIDDPSIENIDINGCDVVWVTHADGTKESVDGVAETDDELIEMIRSAAARFGLSERRFDNACPDLDLRLPDGSRLSALMSVTPRPSISVRRHRYVRLSLAELEDMGAFGAEVGAFLAAAVRARKNIVVAGAMNSGKTTLVRALVSEIPPRERIVTIEQAFELGLDTMPERHPDLVALEARPANSEGEGEITMARLVRRALRMNADRVVVGEVLGDEVLPMLNAMSQGRAGSMCTIHADSSAGVFRRLATYALQAPERLPLEATNMLIAGAVHFVVYIDVADVGTPAHPGTAAPGGARRDHRIPLLVPTTHFETVRRTRFVSSIREVVDAEGLQVVSNEIFRPGADGHAVAGAPLRTATTDALSEQGYDAVWWRSGIRGAR